MPSSSGCGVDNLALHICDGVKIMARDVNTLSMMGIYEPET